MQKSLLNSSWVIMALFCATSAMAQLANYDISATVYQVYDPGNILRGEISVGQTITGSYTFDLGAVDEDPSPEYARYNQFNAPGFNLVINNQSIRSDNTTPGFMNEMHLGNSMSDHFHVYSWGNTPLHSGAMFSDITIDLYDPNGLALNSTALSQTPPDVNAFTYRDLALWGNELNSSFHVIAKINSLTSSGQNNPPSDIVTFNVKALVKDVYDPAGVFSGSVGPGQTLEGSYTFNLTARDDEPAAEIGRYIHRPGSGQYGFDLSLGAYQFRTDSNRVEFVLDLYNGTPAPDHYGAFSYGPNHGLPNGATVEDIGLHLYDEAGLMLSSTQLSVTPPVISNTATNYNEIYIWGMHPNGRDMYSIVAQVQEISAAAADTPSLVNVSPASGLFDRAQRIDLALIFQANLPPLREHRLFINGNDETPNLYNCMPGAPNAQNRFTLVCRDFFQRIGPMLVPGKNRLDFTFILEDNTLIQESVQWEMLDF